MKIDITGVSIERFKGNFFVFVNFEGGFTRSFSLSNDKFYLGSRPSDCISSDTVYGFLSLSDVKWCSCSTRSDLASIELPTCCGYVSRRGKWLRTGRYHRRLVINLPKLLGDIYIS